MLAVQQPDGFDRGVPFQIQQLGLSSAAHQLPSRFEGEIQPVAVKLLDRLQSILTRPMSGEEFGVGGIDLFRSAVEA